MSKQPPAKFLILQHMALKQGGRCVYCGVAMLTEWRECHADWGWKSPFRMTWDHIIPKARGGSNDPSNAAAACRQCNTRKADMPAEKYILTMMPNPINQPHEAISTSNPRARQQYSCVAFGEIQFARASEEDRNDRGY